MKLFRWIKRRITHKIEHLKWSTFKTAMKAYGLPLVIILIVWEIVEDVLFPLLFILLGNHIHPAFYAAVPASWLLCLHWLAVPFLFGLWLKISGKKRDKGDE